MTQTNLIPARQQLARTRLEAYSADAGSLRLGELFTTDPGRGQPILVDSTDVVPEVHAVLDRMAGHYRAGRGRPV